LRSSLVFLLNPRLIVAAPLDTEGMNKKRTPMPEPARFVPVERARVCDLNFRRTVDVTCRKCRYRSEVSVMILREHLSGDAPVRTLGRQFRCTKCGHRGADIDPRRALGR
jgi:DNA-directed RNA polymerase subunit M/transcription elongation factor TFIIS